MATETKSKRIFYFDALRALAILSVILIHTFNTCTNLHTFYTPYPSLSWFLAVFLGNYSRVGVDLFLMLSGALSLGREWEISSFLSKRIPRISYPFIFWGFVLSLFMVGFSYVHPDAFFTLTQYDLSSFIYYLRDSYLAINDGFSSYWFFWLILGTYLIMPVYNKWLLNCDMKEVEYFLVIWLFVTVFVSFDLTCPVDLTYFTGAIGVVVLGYYLRYSEREIYKNPYFIVMLMVCSFFLLTTATFQYTLPGVFIRINRFHIFIIMEVVGIFLLFRNFSLYFPKAHLSKRPIFSKSVSLLAKYSYGLYLTHRALILVVYYLVGMTNYVYAAIAVVFVLTTLLAVFIMHCFNHVPYLNRIIGSK